MKKISLLNLFRYNSTKIIETLYSVFFLEIKSEFSHNTLVTFTILFLSSLFGTTLRIETYKIIVACNFKYHLLQTGLIKAI